MVALKEFVEQSIRNITEGVKGAQSDVSKLGGRIVGGNSQDIEFDVAVTTTEEDRDEGGIGIFVGGLGIGTKGEASATNQLVSRIKFAVRVILPGDE